MMRPAKPWLLIAALGLLAALVVPALAAASFPPLPRPRPEHMAQPGPADATDQQTDRQKLIKQGFPGGEDSDALMPPPDTAVDATKLGTTPQKVTLVAEITEKGGKIGAGLVWRVYDTRPDKNGQLALVAKSEEASPTLTLKPGDYAVHVAYGRAQASDTLSVGNSATSKSMILDAGGLKLNAAITGDIPIPFNLLHFDIFTAGTTDADRALIAEKVGADNIVTLNAGTYHIVSYFGDVNAVVRADLQVAPGQLTEATLYHKAAQVAFKLVTEAGGEAIADVDWTVKASDGQSVFTNTGTFPTAVLEEGDYTVLAKRGDKVYNRAFQVKAGKPVDIEVLTAVY
ncbi:MAG: hypothetical protein P4M09_00570 [Devosia sp.]|nr:hypothetical protein [Devosia sp.]